MRRVLFASILVFFCYDSYSQALNSFIFPEDCFEYPLIFTIDHIDDKSVTPPLRKEAKKNIENYVADSSGGKTHIITKIRNVKNYPINKYKYEVRGLVFKNYRKNSNKPRDMITFQFFDRTKEKTYFKFCVPAIKQDRKNGNESVNGYQVEATKTKVFFKSLQRISSNLKSLGPKETWSKERTEQVKYVKKKSNRKKGTTAAVLAVLGLTALFIIVAG